jgi:hypothetical protein
MIVSRRRWATQPAGLPKPILLTATEIAVLYSSRNCEKRPCNLSRCPCESRQVFHEHQGQAYACFWQTLSCTQFQREVVGAGIDADRTNKDFSRRCGDGFEIWPESCLATCLSGLPDDHPGTRPNSSFGLRGEQKHMSTYRSWYCGDRSSRTA